MPDRLALTAVSGDRVRVVAGRVGSRKVMPAPLWYVPTVAVSGMLTLNVTVTTAGTLLRSGATANDAQVGKLAPASGTAMGVAATT